MEIHKRGHDIERIARGINGKDRQSFRDTCQRYDFPIDSVCDHGNAIVADGQEWRVQKMLGEPYTEVIPSLPEERVIIRRESSPGKRRRRNLKRKRRLR